MPRCANCGKANREGSIFCQDCGQKLEAAPAAPRKSGQAPVADGPVCPACGAVNPLGMNFCKMCGTSLAQPRPATAPAQAAVVSSAPAPPPSAVPLAVAAAGSGKVTCASCGRPTPSGFAFCQHCGQKLGTPSAVQRVPSAVAATVAVPEVNPTPPGGVQPAKAALAATMAAPPSLVSKLAASPASVPPPASQQVAVAATMAAPARPPSQARAAANPQPLPQGAKTDPELAHGRLILVRRDGSDGDVHPLVGEVFDVGRLEGSLIFSDDPYLAPRHARFTWSGTQVKVRSLDAVNGVYVRVRGGVDLSPGDTILIGKEVLRFELLSAEERDPPSLVEHGVRIFGTVQREGWGRLRQLTAAGTTRDVYHLTRPELVLGREEGDVTFPDDEYLSRRHATVRRGPAGRPGARLEDMNSSNGTYLRLRSEVEVKAGDVLRLGDHLLRFEP